MAGDLIGAYQSVKPEVMLIDADLGGRCGGLEEARRVLSAHRDAKIVILAQELQEAIYRETYRIGALAYLTKDREAEDLALAIARVRIGRLFFMPHIAEHLASMKVRGDNCPQDLLDGREFEVFRLIALGYTNQEIANELALSLKTISSYSMNIKQKLRTERIAELTRIAVRFRVIEP
jgi:DNA-binding NarL/FixJ family response regulator